MTSMYQEDKTISGDEELGLRVRIIAAIPRSGSTLFMRIFREQPECAVTSRLVLMGNHSQGGDVRPDYTIFNKPTSLKVYQETLASEKTVLVSKEELGHEYWKGECDYNIFPDQSSIVRTRPGFLFRDPLRVFDSWKAVGWTDVESLAIAYRSLYHTWLTSDQAGIAITYEELISQPSQTLTRLCHHWGVEYSSTLLSFQHPFGDFYFSSDRERHNYTVHNPLGLFTTVQSNQTINADIKSHGLLTMAEKALIEQKLGAFYISTYGERINPVRECLLSKTHFGFDLDDTLHEFRKASGTASAAVFAHLPEHSATTPEELKATYSVILSQATSGAFVDGKSSDDYRRERFSALAQAHNIEISNEDMQHLLNLYKTSLQAALTLKSGAFELLVKLKTMGKKIVLVTEGPEDAQNWTLENLCIADKVDILITSNKVGKSKTGGLFSAVLEQVGIEANDMVFMGDNYSRDILPAREVGITTIHYDEAESIKFEVNELRINSLWKLSELLENPIDHAKA